MSVPTEAVQATFAATLVDEWVRCGVTDAVLSPGSRSAPLALALAERQELTVHVRLDERSAGFFALGLARSAGRPTIVCTTSGTAAVELHPAVTEAHYARVPLVVCTADRPPELHHVGAPQSIDQTHLFGTATRWFCEPGVPDLGCMGTWRSLGARAVAEATDGPLGPGPVHLNLAFTEPLVAQAGPLPEGRADGQPWHRTGGIETASDAAVAAAADWAGRRGVVVAGEGCGNPDDVLALAARLGWPVLADPSSGCRLARPGVVAAADALVRARSITAALTPDLVLMLGAPWASKALGQFLAEAAEAGALVCAIDPWWRWRDPERMVAQSYRSQGDGFLQAALGALGLTPPVDEGWRGGWVAAESAAQRAIDTVLSPDAVSEPAVARRLLAWVPPGATLFVSSSMPVRDLECYGAPREPFPRVLANRGANGIDGVCSSAQGAAAAGLGPVIALVGDLAFFHDVSSLVRPKARPSGSSCTLVVLDNAGGGIFSFLPQTSRVEPGRFEMLFGTPQQPEVLEVARGFGITATEVASLDELDAALAKAVGVEELTVICARVPGRTDNVTLHDTLNAAVADAASAALGLG